jgi:hypothetical protein
VVVLALLELLGVVGGTYALLLLGTLGLLELLGAVIVMVPAHLTSNPLHSLPLSILT